MTIQFDLKVEVSLFTKMVRKMTIWFYQLEGQEALGPVPTETLKTLAKNGKLKPTDLIWKDGYEKWVKAKRLQGLFPKSIFVLPPIPDDRKNKTESTSGQNKQENIYQIKIQPNTAKIQEKDSTQINLDQLINPDEELRAFPESEDNTAGPRDINNTAPMQDNKDDTINIFLKSDKTDAIKSQPDSMTYINLSSSALQDGKKTKNNKILVSNKVSRTINKKVEQKTIDAINKWSRTWYKITTPSDIMKSSKVVYCEESKSTLITLTLNHADIKGMVKSIPCSQSSVSIDIIPETLFECRPILLKEEKEKSKQLELGKIRSCANCRGSGNLKCSECNGAGQKKCWRCDGHGNSKDAFGKRTTCTYCTHGRIICSCGNGQLTCEGCAGYGKTRSIFHITEKRLDHSNKFTDYKGCIPNNKVLETTGSHLYSKRFEFPFINWQKELKKDLNCYQKVLKEFANLFSSDLVAVDGILNHIDFLNGKLNDFFLSMPNPKTSNEALKSEILPQSLDILIEQFEAKTIKFRYKTRENISTAHVFGKEMRVHGENMPFVFTPALFFVFILFLSAIMIPLVMLTINK